MPDIAMETATLESVSTSVEHYRINNSDKHGNFTEILELVSIRGVLFVRAVTRKDPGGRTYTRYYNVQTAVNWMEFTDKINESESKGVW
jgi:hypothetical protein